MIDRLRGKIPLVIVIVCIGFINHAAAQVDSEEQLSELLADWAAREDHTEEELVEFREELNGYSDLVNNLRLLFERSDLSYSERLVVLMELWNVDTLESRQAIEGVIHRAFSDDPSFILDTKVAFFLTNQMVRRSPGLSAVVSRFLLTSSEDLAVIGYAARNLGDNGYRNDIELIEGAKLRVRALGQWSSEAKTVLIRELQSAEDQIEKRLKVSPSDRTALAEIRDSDSVSGNTVDDRSLEVDSESTPQENRLDFSNFYVVAIAVLIVLVIIFIVKTKKRGR